MFSAVYNYEINCRLVFRTGESRESFLEYAALAAGNLILDSMILGILVRGGIPLYVAKVMTECIMFLFSWIMQHQIIFRKNTIFRGTVLCVSSRKCICIVCKFSFRCSYICFCFYTIICTVCTSILKFL